MNRKYKRGEIVGEGASGVVWSCVERSTGRVFACKSVPKSKLKHPLKQKDFTFEITSLFTLQNEPHIIQMREAYADSKVKNIAAFSS
jgi:calcium-dependent protein kinase